MQEVTLSNLELIGIVFAILIVDVGLLLWWHFTDGMQPFTAFTYSSSFSGALVQHTTCRTSNALYAIFAWKSFLILAGCILSWITRNLDPAFAESKALVLMLYQVNV
jgi:hypothetical protein